MPEVITRGTRVDWAAILAGATIATAIGLVLTTFGLGIGLSANSPYEGEGVSPGMFTFGAGLWLLFVQLFAFGAGPTGQIMASVGYLMLALIGQITMLALAGHPRRDELRTN